MDGLQVLDTLKKINPWFKDNKVPSSRLEDFKRREFSELEQTLENTEIATLIIGGRRVGKSVLMHQLIDSLLKKGIDGRKILFIQGDNPIFPEVIKDSKILNHILEIYQKYIIEQTFDDLQESIYIFIDEAHSLKGWQLEVKTNLDLKYKIKFIVTGSSSFELRRVSPNPLTGRVSVHVIAPFSFADYFRYGLNRDGDTEEFKNKLFSLHVRFRESLLKGDLESTYRQLKSAMNLTLNYQLKKKLDDYLFVGGFPLVITNPKNKDVYLRDLLTSTISKDILAQVDAREPQAFERLMVNLCLSVGNTIKFKGLAERLGIDERTVSRYVDYYVESHWAFVSSPYVFHRKADSIKTYKKIYVIDSGIINTLSFKDKSDFQSDTQYKGKILENAIHNHLLTLKQTEFGAFQSSVPFWLEEKDSKEIDFIFEIKNGVIPIESKYKIQPDVDDLITMKEFVKTKTSAKFGIVTTEDALEIHGKVLLIPYSIFMLLI
ncbi:ATP-binding protein [Candidatus Woesebacteria bacterium]|nr:ATP-binding protein [Candidatus Woesebacteria bacterium]